MSDLHVDFPGADTVPDRVDGCDLVMVAGDTCEGLVRAVETLRRAFPRTEIAMVAGNHEFHGRVFSEELEVGRERARSLGVHLLENATASFGDVVVVGATLWTDYELFGAALRVPAMRTSADTMRDHKKIKWRKRPWMRFRPEEARALHVESRRFIEAELSKSAEKGRTAVVLTHHAASIEAVAPRHQRSIVSAAYASELLPIVDRYQPAFWVSGHTHRAMNFMRGRCRLVSNARGYPDEATGFDPDFAIEIDL